jgi:chromosome segregation ATPase
MDGATIERPLFQTPARILIPKLVASREGWKTKAGERKRRLQGARIRIRDLEASRELWRERAQAAERQVAERKVQLEQAQAELAATRSAAAELRDELKKT